MSTTATTTREILTPTAREYLRVSADRSGRQRSVTDQHTDNGRHAESQGFALGEPYREKGAVSASRYSTKTRDGFDDLISDLGRGRFGADILMMWESSRGSRRVGEWVTLIDVCEENGVKIYVTSHGKLYDPANARDRRSLLEDAMDSEYESSKISSRVSRTMAEQAAQGRPHGVPPYGYLRVHDPRTGKLITWEPDPERAPIIRELFDRLRKGGSFRSIEADFEARGIVNRRGTPFSAPHLRDMAIKAVYAGLRTYKGDTIEGTWPALVDRAVFYDVQRIITAPERRTSRSGRAVHELTMTIRCDVCSGPLAATNRSDGRQPGHPQYHCHDKGCIRIDKEGVDDLVIGVILGYLAREDVYESLTASQEDSDEVARLDDEIAQARLDLAEAENSIPANVHEARMFARTAEGLTKTLSTLETQRKELTVPPVLSEFLKPHQDVTQRWADTPISARREIARILLTPEVLGEVRVTRSASAGHRRPTMERVIWRRDT